MHPSLTMLAYYVHDLNPQIFRISFLNNWGPRWYGVAYLLGFLFAYLLIKKNARDGMLRLNPERVPDMVLNGCIFGVLVGGRLGFVLFYDLPIALHAGRTPLLWDFSPINPGGSFPFWGVLKVWDGGMAAHGGIVFTILTLLWFARKYKDQGANVINIGDAACMVVPIGLFFGRCANFINGELYGHPTTVPWAVKFPSEIYAPTNGTPDPTVDAKLSGLILQLKLPVDMWKPDGGIDQGIKMIHTRLLNHDAETLKAVANILPARHPSQLYEALLEGLLLFIICWTIGRKWRKDGMASGAFLTFYPIMRIIGEQFRVGDTPAQLFGMEISKGVLYSLPLVVGGAIYWGYFIRRSKLRPWQGFPLEAAKAHEKPAAKPEAKPTQGT